MTPITYDRLQAAGWARHEGALRSYFKGMLRCDGYSVWHSVTFCSRVVDSMEDIEQAERELS